MITKVNFSNRYFVRLALVSSLFCASICLWISIFSSLVLLSSQTEEDMTYVHNYYITVTSEDGDVEYIPCTIDKGYSYKPGGTKHPQSRLAHTQIGLDVCGLEIGAASYAPFGLNTVDVGLTEDLAPNDFWMYHEHQLNESGCANEIQLGRNAEDLHGIANSSIHSFYILIYGNIY